ncbi:hypothetical protein [Anaerolentibacter hominis]|uniref:hypothetical protein n=1 Tax=Anaerolentibacter hominis TaxID=3079009 RepID=UPI0031B7F1EF
MKIRKIMCAGVILLLTLTGTTSCLGQSADKLNRIFYQNLAQFGQENPLSLTMPPHISRELWFWQIERNFVFRNIAEKNGSYVIETSAAGEDLEWFRKNLLSGIAEDVKIQFKTDPDLERHRRQQEALFQSDAFLKIRESARGKSITAFLTWAGFLYIKAAPPNDYIRIYNMDGHELLVDTPTREHKEFLENVIFGEDILLSDANLTGYGHDTAYDDISGSDNLSIQVNGGYLEDGLLFYHVTSAIDRELDLSNYALESWDGKKWNKVPHHEQSFIPYFIDSLQPYGELFGTFYLNEFEYLEKGRYRFILDFSSRSEVLFYEFSI